MLQKVESTENWLESESELESDFLVNLESESESHMGQNRASLIVSEVDDIPIGSPLVALKVVVLLHVFCDGIHSQKNGTDLVHEAHRHQGTSTIWQKSLFRYICYLVVDQL